MLSHQLFSVMGILSKPGLPCSPSIPTGSYTAPMAWDNSGENNALNLFDAVCRGQSHEGGLYP